MQTQFAFISVYIYIDVLSRGVIKCTLRYYLSHSYILRHIYTADDRAVQAPKERKITLQDKGQINHFKCVYYIYVQAYTTATARQKTLGYFYRI